MDRLRPHSGYIEQMKPRISRFRSNGLGAILSPRSLLFWTVLFSAAALCVVAFLQYRGTARLNDAQEIRIGSNLQSRMMDWHLDLYREFTAICVALQVGPDSGAQDGWNAYAQRYSEWSRETSTAGLIRGIYLLESSQPGKPRFLRILPETSRIELQERPAELQPLLTTLQAHSGSLSAALQAWRNETSSIGLSAQRNHFGRQPRARGETMTGWQFDAGLPAIVHPIFHHKDPFENPRFSDLFALYENEKSPMTRAAIDWIIVLFDRMQIAEKALPELTNRYFQEQGKLAYKVAVTTQGQEVLYSSDADFQGGRLAKADATMNIFGPPPESTEGHFWQTVHRGESLRVEDWRSFAGPVWFPVIRNHSGSAPWILMVQRRGDPLEVILERTKWRNLAISGGVFCLLGLSMSLVLIASHRAQRLAELQMDFVAAVSHELRTPLTVICSAAENMIDGLVDSKQQFMRYGSVIRNQGRQLTVLVDQVLLFASTLEGRSRYQIASVDVAETVKRVLENVSALAERSGVTIESDLPDDLPPVMADATALSHCLQNLVVNGVKYSGEHKWVRVWARVVDPRPQPEVQISVQDRGIGVSGADLPHIFEPFYRSPDVQAAQIHGAGLGLTLARRIAEAMGGTLSVSSIHGEGSVFTLHMIAAATNFVSRDEEVVNSKTE
jgi:signal transduction histidine kinase